MVVAVLRYTIFANHVSPVQVHDPRAASDVDPSVQIPALLLVLLSPIVGSLSSLLLAASL